MATAIEAGVDGGHAWLGMRVRDLPDGASGAGATKMKKLDRMSGFFPSARHSPE
jgi:hypothetical protein